MRGILVLVSAAVVLALPGLPTVEAGSAAFGTSRTVTAWLGGLSSGPDAPGAAAISECASLLALGSVFFTAAVLARRRR